MEHQFSSLIERFNKELKATTDAGHPEPTAMTLSTVSKDGFPSSRVVLLKNLDDRGFVFYTNLGSQKSQELMTNPKVGLNFMWHNISKQIRVQGIAQMLTLRRAPSKAKLERGPRSNPLRLSIKWTSKNALLNLA